MCIVFLLKTFCSARTFILKRREREFRRQCRRRSPRRNTICASIDSQRRFDFDVRPETRSAIVRIQVIGHGRTIKVSKSAPSEASGLVNFLQKNVRRPAAPVKDTLGDATCPIIELPERNAALTLLIGYVSELPKELFSISTAPALEWARGAPYSRAQLNGLADNYGQTFTRTSSPLGTAAHMSPSRFKVLFLFPSLSIVSG